MIRFVLILLLLAGLSRSAAAQALYLPRDIQQAFNKGTRSPDGRPGPRYWQNRARYDITVQARPPATFAAASASRTSTTAPTRCGAW